MTEAESVPSRVERLRTATPAGVTVETTTSDAVDAALAAAVERPAVGTPLPFDGVSLVETGVDVLPVDDDTERAEERGRLLRRARTGVTPAGLAIAERGSVTVRSRATGDELVSLYPERHVAVLAASDVVADVRTAFATIGKRVDEGATGEVLTTGPSATADMGALVEGVHGPREVCVLVLEDR